MLPAKRRRRHGSRNLDFEKLISQVKFSSSRFLEANSLSYKERGRFPEEPLFLASGECAFAHAHIQLAVRHSNGTTVKPRLERFGHLEGHVFTILGRVLTSTWPERRPPRAR